MKSFKLVVAAFVGLVVTQIFAQAPPSPAYGELVAKLKKGDLAIDFLRLRTAFTTTPQYDPYRDAKPREQMMDALNKKEYAMAIDLADTQLKTTYVDLKAHLVASLAHGHLKNDERSKFHKNVFLGLFKSILKSGDGKTPASAYVVISPDEEYVVLDVLGIRKTQQGLIEDKGQKIDRIDGIDPGSNSKVTLYFNVTTPFQFLGKQLKNGK